MSGIPLSWWAEEPKNSTATRFWVKIPKSYFQERGGITGQLRMLYSNPNTTGEPPPLDSVVRAYAKYIRGWEINPSTYDNVNKRIAELTGDVNATANIITTRALPPFQNLPSTNFVSFIGKEHVEWYAPYLPLKNTEFIQITPNLYLTPHLERLGSMLIFTLAIDLLGFNEFNDGYMEIKNDVALLSVYDNLRNELFNLRMQGQLIASPTHSYSADITLKLCRHDTAWVTLQKKIVWNFPAATRRATVIHVFLQDVTSTQYGYYRYYKLGLSAFGEQRVSTASLFTHYVDYAISEIVIGAWHDGSHYTRISGIPFVGLYVFAGSANNAPALSASCDGGSRVSHLIYHYTRRANDPQSGALLLLPPVDKIHLATHVTDLRHGQLTGSTSGYRRYIDIYIRNPEGLSVDMLPYEFITLPIVLNTQGAINDGILKPNLADVSFIALPTSYTPPSPPPPPPPEELPPSVVMPAGGKCVVLFADATNNNPVHGLAYNELLQSIYDSGIEFPSPLDDTNKMLRLHPILPYGVTFVRWKLEYVDSNGNTKVVYGNALPISTKGLDINSNFGLRVTFYVRGERGYSAPPSSDASKKYSFFSSRYIIVPERTPTWVSGDYTIRYSVGSTMWKETGDFSIRYSVGIDYTPAAQFLYQNIRTGEESWEMVFASPTGTGAHPIKQHLQGFRLRHFHVDGNYAYLLVVSDTPPVRVKLITINLQNKQISSSAPATLGAEWDNEEKGYYPSFGAVAVGHGGMVYANTHGAAYFPFNGTREPLLLPFLSSMFPVEEKRWSNVGILVVPEGFLFLPYAILWDLDTYYDYATNLEISEGDRVIPVYFEGIAGVVVRSKEYTTGGGNLKAFYVWGGFNRGLVRAQVDAAEDMEKIPPYLGGALLNNKWYAFNAAAHPDESTIVEYTLETNPNEPANMEDWKFTVNSALRVLPLPFSAPALRARWKPPAWGEIWSFNTTASASYIYFSRVWDRIYRLDAKSKEIRLAHVIPYLDFGGNIVPRFMGGEEAWLMFSYNLADGKVYAAHLRSGERLQIWRQTYSVTPPPAPIITFPPADIQVPRQFDVQFKPQAYTYPQEFSVTIMVETSQGVAFYHYYSTLHRNLFEVSTNNGVTFSPMRGPVTVSQNNQGNVVVKFNLPYPLPPSSRVTITVRAIGIVS